jgi:hypothetical protein
LLLLLPAACCLLASVPLRQACICTSKRWQRHTRCRPSSSSLTARMCVVGWVSVAAMLEP